MKIEEGPFHDWSEQSVMFWLFYFSGSSVPFKKRLVWNVYKMYINFTDHEAKMASTAFLILT